MEGVGRATNAGLLVVLIGCLLPARRSDAQESPLEFGPELELPAPRECCGDRAPAVAWDGSAFVLVWRHWREDERASDQLMGARLSPEGTYVEGATEMGSEDCALPLAISCDDGGRCGMTCLPSWPSIDEGDRGASIVIAEGLQPVWSARLADPATVLWDGDSFVVPQEHDGTAEVLFIDPDEPSLDVRIMLPPLPADLSSPTCLAYGGSGHLLITCATYLMEIDGSEVMGAWRDLGQRVALRVVGDEVWAAWIEEGEYPGTLRLGTLQEDGLSPVSSVGSDVSFAKLVGLGEGGAVVFVGDEQSSEPDDHPRLTLLYVAALAGLQPIGVDPVARDLPPWFSEGVSPAARNDAASSADTIALVYERIEPRESLIRVRLAGGALSPRGSSCADPMECASGNCADGYCCDRQCGAPCERCDLPGLEGSCGLEPDAGAAHCAQRVTYGCGCSPLGSTPPRSTFWPLVLVAVVAWRQAAS